MTRIARFERFIRSKVNNLEKCSHARSQYCIPRFADPACRQCEEEHQQQSKLPRGDDE